MDFPEIIMKRRIHFSSEKCNIAERQQLRKISTEEIQVS